MPRPRIGTRVMPQSNWNFLDQELLSWWMTEDNFHQVVDHFLVMRSSLEPQACLLAATLATAEQKAQLNALMEEMVFLKKHFNRERWVEVDMAWHEHIYMMSANPFLTSFRFTLSFGVPHLLYLYYTKRSGKTGIASGDSGCHPGKRRRKRTPECVPGITGCANPPAGK